MTAHELMVRTNHYLIQGGTLTPAQADTVVRRLLAARSTPQEIARFHRGLARGVVKYPGASADDVARMYPAYYAPEYNEGKKLQTVIPPVAQNTYPRRQRA